VPVVLSRLQGSRRLLLLLRLHLMRLVWLVRSATRWALRCTLLCSTWQ
jgi:hypothetical protein